MGKLMYVIGALLIAGFAVLGVMEMQTATTPYITSVVKAQAVGNRPMQFKGFIVHNKTSYDKAKHELKFALADDTGRLLTVRYAGVKPGNFDSADIAVVRGTYRNGALDASQLLLKCPSKYKN